MAAVYDFNIDQGTFLTFDVQIWTDTAKTTKRDLTGYEVKSQVRRSHNSTTAVWDKTTLANPTSISFPSGRSLGLIRFFFAPAETRAFIVGKSQWDAELYQVADVTKDERFIEGIVITNPEVTR